jgi:hypothetical protein
MLQVFTKLRGLLVPLMVLLLPGLAFAAPAAAQGPTRKEIVVFSIVALALLALTVVLYRLVYGYFLDRGWPVDFAMGVSLFLFLVGVASTFLLVFLQLWPKPWSTLAWFADLGLVALLVIFAIVGHSRYSA